MLKAQCSHALADGGEIVGGAGCVRRHVGSMITLPRQIVVRAARLVTLSAARARSFPGQPPGLAVDEVVIILDRCKIVSALRSSATVVRPSTCHARRRLLERKTGRRKAKNPASATPIVINVVAAGRPMNGADGFTLRHPPG